jgi:Ca-activated chloride channel homolog
MNFLHDWGITFVNPWLLLLLILVPLLAFLLGNRGGVPAVVFSSTAPLRTLGKSAESKAGEFLTGLMFLALALFIIALARPQEGKSLSHVEASGIDVMMAIDVSGSMLTEDYVIDGERASRIDKVKQVTRNFIEGRPNDRIGLIAFGGVPYLVSPLTLDHDWLLQNLDRVKIGLVADNTAIGSGIAACIRRLKNSDSKSKVIILVTDGDNNSGKVSPETAAEAAKALGIKLHAIGVGTNGVAPFPLSDQRTGEPLRDQEGRKVYQDIQVSFNEDGLKKVAHIANGSYYRAADTESLDNIFSEIDRMEKHKAELTMYKQYRDLYPWFLAAGLAVLAVQVVLSQTAWRKLP